MSWQELARSHDIELRESPFELDRFGISVDRLVVPFGVDVSLEEIRALAHSSVADVVVVRYPASRIEVFAGLRGIGRDLLFCDALVYWRLRTGEGRRPRPTPELITRVAPGLTVELVTELVEDVFAGYANHYAANPLFDPSLALSGYVEWAVRSIRESSPVLTSRSERPVALATLGREADHIEVELAGVRPDEQGKGVYAHLFAGVEDVALAQDVPEVLISTQVHNTDVQRAWARFGLEPVDTCLTLHLVREGLLPQA